MSVKRKVPVAKKVNQRYKCVKKIWRTAEFLFWGGDAKIKQDNLLDIKRMQREVEWVDFCSIYLFTSCIWPMATTLSLLQVWSCDNLERYFLVSCDGADAERGIIAFFTEL